MKDNRQKNVVGLAILAILAVSILSISYFRIFDGYELETLDLRFRLRPALPVTDKVVLIEISEDSIEAFGRWPFDRNNHAIFIKALSSFGARAVLFDIFFSEPSQNDESLGSAIREAGNVYMPVVLELDLGSRGDVVTSDNYQASTIGEYRSAVKGEGQINIIPDQDGKFRRVPIFVNYKGKSVPYISFLIACDYLGIPQKDISFVRGKYIQAGAGIKVPLGEKSEMLINYSGPWGTRYKHYSYVDVIQSYLAPTLGQEPILKPEAFKDKICVVGLTASGTSDLHPNPFESVCPGMGIHAEVMNSFLNNKFISRLARSQNAGVLAILLVVLSLVSLKAAPSRALIFMALFMVAYIVAAFLVFDIYGIWIDVFYPVIVIGVVFLGLMLYRFGVEWKKRLVLESELSVARKIQYSLLPASVPKVKGLDIAVEMSTARQVGGDMYDFLVMGESKLGVMIGDVSGKGIPASLFMALVTGAFKFFSGEKLSTETTLADLNSRLVKDSASNLFVTMYYLIMDMSSQTLSYANAGHLPILHLKKDGQAFLDVSDGMPLGLVDGPYTGMTSAFDHGDILVLYTDGVTEAMDRDGDLYGKERMASIVSRSRHSASKDIVKAVIRDIKKFESGAEQHDDITIVVIKVKS